MFNRRSFLAGLGALVGGVALEKAIPFGRVWSFPTNIVVPKPNTLLTIPEISRECLKILEKNLSIRWVRTYDAEFDRSRVRLDMLNGWADCYPESACRIAS